MMFIRVYKEIEVRDDFLSFSELGQQDYLYDRMGEEGRSGWQWEELDNSAAHYFNFSPYED